MRPAASHAGKSEMFRLPDETRLSRVHLRTAHLERALAFYQNVIGLTVARRKGPDAPVSATGGVPEILLFTEAHDAVRPPHRVTGLYHFAIRFPTRRDLAGVVQRLLAAEYPIRGASDHGMSESIHISDPDGNGVELYYDRPRSDWPMRDGRIQLIMQPLDLDGLLATTSRDATARSVPAQTDIGHVNLHVADLQQAEAFFHDFLGLDVMARIEDSATFLSAGGYHHHVAINTWAGKTPPPANSVGLISYRVLVPSAQSLADLKKRAKLFDHESRTAGDVLQVRDPNSCWLEVESASGRP